MTLSNAAHAAMHNALETAQAIMRESAVVERAGYAYTADETETIQRGVEALRNYEPRARGHVARLRNEDRLTLASQALDMADILRERNGFQDVKNTAWTDNDQRVIRAGLEASHRSTQHCRN